MITLDVRMMMNKFDFLWFTLFQYEMYRVCNPPNAQITTVFSVI